MKNKTEYNIYLAGAITGLAYEDVRGWREQFLNLMPALPHVNIFDPTEKLKKLDLANWETIQASYPKSAVANAATVFHEDITHLLASHIVVVNHSHPSYGSAFEAGVAWYNGSQVIHIFTKEYNDAIQSGATAPHPFKVGTYADDVADAVGYATRLIQSWDDARDTTPIIITSGSSY